MRDLLLNQFVSLVFLLLEYLLEELVDLTLYIALQHSFQTLDEVIHKSLYLIDTLLIDLFK